MPKWFSPAAVLCGLMFVVSPVLIARAPDESTMGMVYKIYYYHMPSAWMFLLAPLVCGVVERALPGARPARGRPPRVGGGGAHGALRRADAHHRTAVGAARVGHVVGVGRAADVEPGGLDDRRGPT